MLKFRKLLRSYDWSRKIVGYYAGDTLEAEECLMALSKAVKGLAEGYFPIHHSDRGCQYCSHRYTETLREYGLGISMTEENHCYENAVSGGMKCTGLRRFEMSIFSSFSSFPF